MDRSAPQTTLSQLIDGYDALLFDAYGVLVDSAGARPGAKQIIDLLNRIRKPYYVLTNDSSRLPSTSARRFQSLGLDIETERVVTSGILIGPYFRDHDLVRSNCAVVGTEDSIKYVSDAGGRIVTLSDRFDTLVLGAPPDEGFARGCEAVMNALFRRLDEGATVHLILMNPDLIYPAGPDSFRLGVASLALVIEAALQLRFPERPDTSFIRLGKPYSPIFEEARRLSGTMNMVMIGDSAETDIRGANSFGIDSVLIETGLSKTADSLPSETRPTYRMPSLAPLGPS